MSEETYLEKLERIAEERGDDRFIHASYVHFIQQKLSDENSLVFLKAAIYSILELVPLVFPYDFPEQVEKGGEDFGATEEQIEAVRSINKNLLIPIIGYDVVRAILAAREYEEL